MTLLVLVDRNKMACSQSYLIFSTFIFGEQTGLCIFRCRRSVYRQNFYVKCPDSCCSISRPETHFPTVNVLFVPFLYRSASTGRN